MKNLIFSKYNQLSILFRVTLIAGTLLMFRIKITQSFYLLFLVWNLFLAGIPYAITFFMQLKDNWFESKWSKGIAFVIWLLFLPNAPYIISDFTHLRWSSTSSFVLDAFIIGSFAVLGLLYLSYTVKDMKKLILSTLSRKQNFLFNSTLCILIGFGIYLGRYLRWNSWDVVQNPLGVLVDIGTIVIHPFQYKFAWLVTVSYGLLSWASITFINKLPQGKPTRH